MKLQLSVVGILTVYYFLRHWTDEISKVVEPLIKEAERLSLDGVIDKDDRKKLVMLAISNLEKDGKLKLNFITRFIISKIVDIIARKLPDFVVTQDARELLTKVDKG